MEQFKIVKLHDEPYDFLIIAASYENPFDHFSEIKEKISTQTACLLFDLTLINGTSSNRYIKCNFNANLKVQKSCSIVDKVDDHIRMICRDFFVNNDDVIRNGTIPNALKYLLKTGDYPI